MRSQHLPALKTAFAKARRKASSRIEQALWRELRAGRLNGWKFKREAPIGPYVADFVCFEARLLVEADGPIHDSPERRRADGERDAWFKLAGFRTLRFGEEQILGNLASVVDAIGRALSSTTPSPDRLRRPPSPSRGEGQKEPGRVLVIACGALAREVAAVLEANGLDHVDLTCLPAILHNRPEKIPEAVRAAIRENRPRYGRIAVAYADCGTGGMLDKVIAEEGATRIEGPHCYAFFSGTQAFLRRGDADMDVFFLTDFLARQFDAFVIEPLGLDRHPELRDTYFAHYRRLVYLQQVADPAIEGKARAAAERLGLAYEKRVTGYGDLAPFLRTSASAEPGTP